MQNEDGQVLIVEDDAMVRELIAMIVEAQGYTPIETSDLTGAAAALTGTANVRLVIADLNLLDGESGQSLIEQLRREGNAVPAILMTGAAEGLGPLPDGTTLMAKPFRMDTLTSALATALGTGSRLTA